MSFTKKQLLFLKQESFQPVKKNLLLAISGGMDSMCLLHFWQKIAQPLFKCNMFVAHLNHGVRKESEKEHVYLKDWCQKNNLPFFYQKLDITKKSPKKSIEEWGRHERYTYFSKISLQNNIDYTLTAHHLNDQWETLILKIMRGTGLKGLQGIHFKTTSNCVRPFLVFSKQELLDYAHQHKLIWFEDSSNSNQQFLRNEIRKKFPPTISDLKQTSKISLSSQKQWPLLEKKFSDNIEKKQNKLSIPDKTMLLWFSTDPWLYFHDLQYFMHQQGLNLTSHHLEEMIRQYKVSPYLVQVQLNASSIFKWRKQESAQIIIIEKTVIKN